MFLSHFPRNAKSVEVKFDLSSFPERSNPEIIQALYPRVRAGHHDAKLEMVRQHVRYAINIASRYCTQTDRDHDIVSAGLLGLAQAVEWISEGKIDHHEGEKNPTGYIVITVHRFCSEFLEFDSQIRIPRRSLEHFGIDIDNLYDSIVTEYDVADLTDVESERHFHECLAQATLNDPYSEEIMRLKEEGYTLEEIGKKLGVSHMTIKRRVQVVFEKFMRLFNEHRNVNTKRRS